MVKAPLCARAGLASEGWSHGGMGEAARHPRGGESLGGCALQSKPQVSTGAAVSPVGDNQ